MSEIALKARRRVSQNGKEWKEKLPQHPVTYPFGWNNAARLAARRPGIGVGVGKVWPLRTSARNALNKHFRVWGKALELRPEAVPEVMEALASGFRLGFRLMEVPGGWTIEVLFRPDTRPEVEMLEQILRGGG